MIKVMFFAALRETLQCAEISVALDGALSLDELKKLVGGRLKGADEILSQRDVLCAVNQKIISEKSPTQILDGDEVAFFPPVTGG